MTGPWRRTGMALLVGLLLAASALPFVVLFPEPPAFGRGGAGIVLAVPILATVGVCCRGAGAGRGRVLRRAVLLFLATAVAVVARILLIRTAGWTMPTIDLLPRLFDLQGEEIDDALLFEAWLGLWVVCAAGVLVLDRVRRAAWPTVRHPATTVPREPARRWNAATVLLWLVGWAVLAGAVLHGHGTAAFLSRAARATGTVASAEGHPLIRFTDVTGAAVEFRQNGFVSRPPGRDVPVAYDTRDPSGTARADTPWANWGVVLGLAWIGLGFTLFPFFGLRAGFRAGRW